MSTAQPNVRSLHKKGGYIIKNTDLVAKKVFEHTQMSFSYSLR